MKHIAVINVATAALFVLFGTSVAHAADRPNLLVIHTDEHHFNTLGCYGGTKLTTPNIDWLSKSGVTCTSFYATTPVCSPSRASLVSGQYPQNTPVTTNNIPLSDNVITFAEQLRRKGYATGYAGKWHLDGGGKPQWEPARDFGFEDNRYMFNRGHWKKLEITEEGPRVAARSGSKPSYSVDGADEETFTTDFLTDRAIEFIEENADRPFCYMVSLPDPHGPNSVRAPYDTMFADVEVEVPKTALKTPEQTPAWGRPEGKTQTVARLQPLLAKYYGMVKCIDDNVGRLIETLKEQELLDNTIIVFTADHGDLCGEHGRHNKGVPYEGSAKIPMIVYYPEKIEAGTEVGEALSCVDFLPTVLSLMDVKPHAKTEGRDASMLLTGKVGDWHDIAFMRGTGGWLAAVTDRYKLVYALSDEPWLFDMEEDPDELENRFEDPDYADVVRQLTEELAAYCKKYKDQRCEEEPIASQMAKVLGKK